MFKREHHLRIATILQALNANLLTEHDCWFGGGTAIVLSHGEYRESVDIDFLVSDRSGYQALRHLLTGQGIKAIARAGMKLNSNREIRADQYGIRTMLQVAETEIKFEIVLEGRIQLEKPNPKNRICGVTTLTALDMASCKLLANSDQWSDDAVFSRDLIKAIRSLGERKGRLEECMTALKMSGVPKALLWGHIRDLKKFHS